MKQENVIPYEAIEALGVKKEQLKTKDNNALLSGKSTDMMKFSIDDTVARRSLLDKENVTYSPKNGKLDFDGKIQLEKYMIANNTEENKSLLKKASVDFEEIKGAKLKFDYTDMRKLAIGAAMLISPVTAFAVAIIPKRDDVKNDRGLSDFELASLKEGNVIARENSKNEKVLMQLDKDTNNLVTVNTRDISIPNKVVGQEVSPIQKEQLKNGKEIVIRDNDNKELLVKLDLNEKAGLAVSNINGEKIEIKPLSENKKISLDEKPLLDIDVLGKLHKQGALAISDLESKKNKDIVETIVKDAGIEKEYINAKKAYENYGATKGDFLEEYKKEDLFNDANRILKEKAGESVQLKEQEIKKFDNKFSTDKERLEHIANNGIKGAKEIYPESTQNREEFLKKNEMLSDFKKAENLSRLSPEEYNKIGGDKTINSINDTIKSSASTELNKMESSVKIKTEKNEETSFKMKM